jgi:hypothetical protein
VATAVAAGAAGAAPFVALVLELRPLLDALTGDGVYCAPARLCAVAVMFAAAAWLVGWLVGAIAVARKVRVPTTLRHHVCCHKLRWDMGWSL